MKRFIPWLFVLITGGCAAEVTKLQKPDTLVAADVENGNNGYRDLEYLCFVGCLEVGRHKKYCEKHCYKDSSRKEEK